MTFLAKNMYVDKLNDKINEYKNGYQDNSK